MYTSLLTQKRRIWGWVDSFKLYFSHDHIFIRLFWHKRDGYIGLFWHFTKIVYTSLLQKSPVKKTIFCRKYSAEKSPCQKWPTQASLSTCGHEWVCLNVIHVSFDMSKVTYTCIFFRHVKSDLPVHLSSGSVWTWFTSLCTWFALLWRCQKRPVIMSLLKCQKSDLSLCEGDCRHFKRDKMPKETCYYVSFEMSKVTFTCVSDMGLLWHGLRLFWHGLCLLFFFGIFRGSYNKSKATCTDVILWMILIWMPLIWMPLIWMPHICTDVILWMPLIWMPLVWMPHIWMPHIWTVT